MSLHYRYICRFCIHCVSSDTQQVVFLGKAMFLVSNLKVDLMLLFCITKQLKDLKYKMCLYLTLLPLLLMMMIRRIRMKKRHTIQNFTLGLGSLLQAATFIHIHILWSSFLLSHHHVSFTPKHK